MTARTLSSRELGLMILVALSLAAIGIVMSIGAIPHAVAPAVTEIILDDMQIVVPRFVEGPGLVHVNQADAAELARLPGIGSVLAVRIIEDREAQGLYESIDDLTRVSGIGPSTVDGFREHATTEAPED